ncbi:uncharacterized protein LOC124459904 [Drosophila willistoni]|uniref:uncharacterized protein LOC124459904 n=1 Tax=Drosophila willistoni TaxID=7260 RepID=UPI001F080FA7|nr:uncharacterized protein LOC124459904 [Drosophila willistoni]
MPTITSAASVDTVLNAQQTRRALSRPGALAQFLKNESRLLKNIPAKTEYDAVIQEYLDLGHMRQVPFDGTNNNFYLPHHAVFKPDSTTTKVRVVFNASSKSTNGVSLNDILYPGPVLQSDLTTQILKWRFFRVVFNADITKMYRQIMVDQIHTPFQRILFLVVALTWLAERSCSMVRT